MALEVSLLVRNVGRYQFKGMPKALRKSHGKSKEVLKIDAALGVAHPAASRPIELFAPPPEGS